MAGITGMPDSMGGSGIGGMLDGSDQRAMEESFKEFCNRPENRTLMEKHQKKEYKNAEKRRMREEAMRFQQVNTDVFLDRY